MANKFRKTVVLMVTVCMAIGTLAACSGGGGILPHKDDNPNATKLYVRYFDAGFGDRWLKAAEPRFEEMYKDFSFEEGKKGVDVVLDPDPATSDFTNAMSTSRDYVYFCEAFNMPQFYSLNIMADITDAMNTPLNESYGKDIKGTPLPGYAGETKSVREKMSADEKQYYLLTEENGGKEKVYAVPYIDDWNGTITYDEDVFEKFKLYYKADNTLGATKGAGKTTTVELGVGPDGTKGTADDGLPRTYKEFFNVCKKMKGSCGVTPFVWAGNWQGYINELLRSLFAQNIGLEQYEEMIAGKGKIRDYIDGAGSLSYNEAGQLSYEAKEVDFDATQNPDELNKAYHSAGLADAINFIYTIIKEGYCNKNNVFNGAYSHTTAQGDFIFGKENGNDYGFLVDGTWWYNEAEKKLELYEKRVKSRKDRHMAYLPLPKANEETFQRTKGANVINSTYISGITVKSGLTPMQQLLAETFVRFYCTNESLAEFNTIVSTPRGLEYVMTDENIADMSPYGETLYRIHSHTQEQTDPYRTYNVKVARDNTRFYKEHFSFFHDFGISSEPEGFSRFGSLSTAFNDNIAKGLDSIKYYGGVLNVAGQGKK